MTVAQRGDRRARRWLGAWLAGAALLALAVPAVLGTRTPARLGGVDPADGAVLQAPPAAVSATFTGAFDPAVFHLNVVSSEGRTVTTGPARLDGATLRAPVSITSAGTYVAVYHVQLQDGGSVSGSSRFTVTGAGPAPAAGRVGDDRAGQLPADGHAHGAGDPVGAGLLVLDLVLLVVLVRALLRGTGRRVRQRR